MKPVTFAPKPGYTRVQVGADPVVEITPTKPYTTNDPIFAEELRGNPFLNVRTAAAKAKAKPKPATAAAPAPAASEASPA